jgi:hypothetical protein
MKLTGENRSTRGKTCPCVTLSATNPTWTDPGSNPGLRGERPANNLQSHGTALHRYNQTYPYPKLNLTEIMKGLVLKTCLPNTYRNEEKFVISVILTLVLDI